MKKKLNILRDVKLSIKIVFKNMLQRYYIHYSLISRNVILSDNLTRKQYAVIKQGSQALSSVMVKMKTDQKFPISRWDCLLDFSG